MGYECNSNYWTKYSEHNLWSRASWSRSWLASIPTFIVWWPEWISDCLAACSADWHVRNEELVLTKIFFMFIFYTNPGICHRNESNPSYPFRFCLSLWWKCLSIGYDIESLTKCLFARLGVKHFRRIHERMTYCTWLPCNHSPHWTRGLLTNFLCLTVGVIFRMRFLLSYFKLNNEFTYCFFLLHLKLISSWPSCWVWLKYLRRLSGYVWVCAEYLHNGCWFFH